MYGPAVCCEHTAGPALSGSLAPHRFGGDVPVRRTFVRTPGTPSIHLTMQGDVPMPEPKHSAPAAGPPPAHPVGGPTVTAPTGNVTVTGVPIHGSRPVRPVLVITVFCLGLFMTLLDITIVNIAIPDLVADL